MKTQILRVSKSTNAGADPGATQKPKWNKMAIEKAGAFGAEALIAPVIEAAVAHATAWTLVNNTAASKT
ncbi:MAG: hypothetical protein AB3N11_05780 [Arenibacterium sp.]